MTEPRAFDEREPRLFTALAQRAALAVQNAQHFAVEQRRAEQFRVIGEVGRSLASILDVDELLNEIVRLIQQAFGYDHVGLALIEGDEAVYRVGAGKLWDDTNFEFAPNRLKVGAEGITGWVAGNGEPLLVAGRQPGAALRLDAQDVTRGRSWPCRSRWQARSSACSTRRASV